MSKPTGSQEFRIEPPPADGSSKDAALHAPLLESQLGQSHSAASAVEQAMSVLGLDLRTAMQLLG